MQMRQNQFMKIENLKLQISFKEKKHLIINSEQSENNQKITQKKKQIRFDLGEEKEDKQQKKIAHYFKLNLDIINEKDKDQASPYIDSVKNQSFDQDIKTFPQNHIAKSLNKEVSIHQIESENNSYRKYDFKENQNRNLKKYQKQNQIVESENPKESIDKKVNKLEPVVDFNEFQFFQEGSEAQMRYFKEQFMQNTHQSVKANKSKIKSFLMQLIYEQVLQKVDEANPEDIPPLFRKNKLRFCALIIKSPKLQAFHNEFQDSLSRLISSQIENNKDIFKLFVNLPRQAVITEQQQKYYHIASSTKYQKDPQFKEFEDLYFKSQNVQGIRKQTNRVNKELEHAKFNYKLIQKERKKRQSLLTGSLKIQRKGQSTGRSARTQKKKWFDSDTESDHEQQEQQKIDDEKQEILDQLKEKLDKERKERLSKAQMNAFQQKIKKSADEINKMIQDMDQNNNELMNEVTQISHDLDNLEDEKKQKSTQKFPGELISNFMRIWDKQIKYTDDEIQIWRDELWISLADYEEKLKVEEKGYQIIHDRLLKKYWTHYYNIKSKSSMRLTALETAFNDSKLKYHREINRLNMIIAEYESKALNDQQQPSEKADIKVQPIKNLIEAKLIQSQLINQLKQKEQEITQLQKQMTLKNNLIESFDQRLDEKDTFTAEERKMRFYYQELVMKQVRDLRLFENDNIKSIKIRMINENDEDINYQRQVIALLDDIDIKQEFINHVNKHFGYNQNIKNVEINLGQLGLLDHSKIDEQYQMVNEKDVNSDLQNLTEVADTKKKSKHSSINLNIFQKQRNPFKNIAEVKEWQEKKKIKYMLKKELKQLIDNAVEAKLDEPVANAETGKFVETDNTHYRQQIAKLMEEINPSALEDFRLKKEIVGGDQSPQIKKKKAEKIKKTVSKTKKQESQDPKAADQKSQAQLNNSSKRQNESSNKKLKKNDSGQSLKKKKKTVDKKGKKKDKKKSKSKKKENEFEKSQFSKIQNIEEDKSDSDQSQQQQDQQQRDMESSHRSINSRDEGSLLNQSQNKSDQILNNNQSALNEDQKTQQISLSSKEKLSKGQISKQNTMQEVTNVEGENANQSLTLDQLNVQNSNQEIHIQESSADIQRMQTNQSVAKDQQEIVQENQENPQTQIETIESQKTLKNEEKQQKLKVVLKEPKKKRDQTDNDQRQLKIKTQNTEQNPQQIEQKKEQKEDQISQNVLPEQKITIESVKDQKPNHKQQENQNSERLQIEEPPSIRIKTNQISFRKQKKKEPSEQVKSFDGDPNFQEIQESIMEQDEEGPKLLGVCLLANELQTLHEKKYNKILKDVQKEIDFDPKQFKMNARQITQLQEFVQATMNKKIPYDILMEDLFKAEIGLFFEKLNHQIVQNFDLENCHKILQNNGKDLYIEEKIQKLNKKEQAAYNKQRVTKLKQVSFGNLFKPNFSETGELMGFEIRHELIQMMYMYNDFELSSLKRAIKACMYMNRILQMGQYMDFALKQMEGDDQEEKTFQDMETQVDEFMIKVYQKENNILQDEEDEESSAESPRDSLIQILRNHGQAVMGRISKQKEAFYQLIFEDIEPEKLLNYYMEDVFDNEQSQKRNLKIQFKKYLVNILDQVAQIFRGLKDEQKQKLKINDILQLNREYGTRQYFHREVQAQPETRSIMSCTGTELLNAFTQGSDLIIKKSKNQLVLDKAMQEEFKKTLEMFDEFANQLINIENKSASQRELNKNKDLLQDLQLKNENDGKKDLLHQDSTEKNDQDLIQPSVQDQTLEQAIEEFKKQWVQKNTNKNIKTIKTEQSKEKMDEENQEVEENEQVVQEQEQEKVIKKLQTNMFSSIEKIKEIGGIKKKLEVVQINLNAQFKKEDNDYTSNANILQQEENMLQVYKQQNNESNLLNNQNQTPSNDPYQSHKFKSLFERQIAKSQQVSKLDIDSLHKILSQTKYVNEEDQQVQGTQHTRDLDIHVQAHKHFNNILRQKLSNIIVKNKERAQQIDKLLNKNLDPKSVSLGYSQHFGGFSQIANELSKNNEFLGNLLRQEKKMKIKNIKQKFELQVQQKKSILVQKGGRQSFSKENQSVQVNIDDGISNRESPRTILQQNRKNNQTIHLEGVKARINYPPEIIVEEEDPHVQNQQERDSILEGYTNEMQSKNDDNIIESDQRVSIKIKKKQVLNLQNTPEDEWMKAKKEFNKNSFKYKLQIPEIFTPQQQVFTPTDLFMDSRGSMKNQKLTNQHTLSPDLKSHDGGFDQNFRNLNTSTDVIPKSIINKALRQSVNLQKKIGKKDTIQYDQSGKNKYINLTRIQTADDKKDIDYIVNSKTRKKNIQLNALKKYQNTLTEGHPTNREVSQSDLQKRSLKVEDQRIANKTQFEMAPNIWSKERGFTAQTNQFISTSQSLTGDKLANKQSFNIYITEFEDGLPDLSKSYQSVNDKKRNGNIVTNIFQQAQQTAQNRQDFEFFKQITQQQVQQQKFNKQQIKLNNQQMKEQLQYEMKNFQERLIKNKNDQQKQYNNYKQSIVLNQNSFRKNSDTDYDSLKQNLNDSEKQKFKVLSSKIHISDESPLGIVSLREEFDKTKIVKNNLISPTNVRGWSRISKQKIEDGKVKIAHPDLFDDVASITLQKNHNSSNIQDGSFQTVSR